MFRFCCICVWVCVAFGAVADDHGSTTIALQGQAGPRCILGPAQSLGGSNMALAQAAEGANTVAIAQLIDPSTAQLNSSVINLKFRALCNYPHAVAIKSANGGLKSASDDKVVGGTFQTFINYSVSYVWGAVNGSLTTSGIAGQGSSPQTVNGAYSGDLQLQISVNSQSGGGLPVHAGSYTDTIIITLGTPL